MSKINLFTSVNYQKEASFSEKAFSLISNYFYLGGAKISVVDQDSCNLESAKISIAMKVVKIASYFLFLPMTLILLGVAYSLHSKHRFTLVQVPPSFQPFQMEVMDSFGVLRKLHILNLKDEEKTVRLLLEIVKDEGFPLYIRKSGNKVEEIIQKLEKEGIKVDEQGQFYLCVKNRDVSKSQITQEGEIIYRISRAQHEDILRSINKTLDSQEEEKTLDSQEEEKTLDSQEKEIFSDGDDLSLRKRVEKEGTIYYLPPDYEMMIKSELPIGTQDSELYLMEVERESKIAVLERVQSKDTNEAYAYIEVNKTPEEALVEIVVKSTCLPTLEKALLKMDQGKFINAFCAQMEKNRQIDPQIHQILSDILRQELLSNEEAVSYFLPQDRF